MGAFSPPWPQTLLEPVEYEALLGVPGHQKAGKHQKSSILGKKAENPQLFAFYLKWVEFSDFSLFGVPGPSKRLHIPLVLEGLEAMGAKRHPFHKNGVDLIKFK